MKHFLLCSSILLLLFSVAGAQTNVTIWLNTSTVPDTVTANSIVQVRGGTAPLTWGDDTGGVMEHVQSDLWKVTLAFDAGAEVVYKFNVRTDAELSGDGWESGLATTSGNHELTVPAADTSLMTQYYVKIADTDPLAPPFTPTDSIDIWLRVNMQGWDNFNELSNFVGVRGNFPSSGWGTSLVLAPEVAGDDAPQFTYPASEFWSGHLQLDAAKFSLGDTVMYKFVTMDNNTPDAGIIDWEGTPDRPLVVPTKDSTIVWDFFSGTPPIRASNEDTVKLTFAVDMTRAIESRGFSPGDTLIARAGFPPSGNAIIADTLLQVAGSTLWTGGVTVVTTIAGELEYEYRLTKFGQDIREVFFDFSVDPSATSAERRRIVVESDSFTVIDTDPNTLSSRRQPFFPSNRILERDVLVTWEVDMRPAIWELELSSPTDTLKDIQGNRDVFDPDSVLAKGVWGNGPAFTDWSNPSGGDWGAGLEANPRKKLYDDGTNGDAVAGDSIFTRQAQYSPDSLAVGSLGRVGQVFKFGIGAGDNEGGFGNNHVRNIDDSESTFTVRAQFGSIDPNKYDHWDYENQRVVTSVELANDLLPGKFALEQNYPNPFNPETSIRYSTLKSGDVKLTVFNLLGQKVASLVDEKQIAGNYLVKWSGLNDGGRAVASGVYVYKIEAAGFVKTKKMLLLK